MAIFHMSIQTMSRGKGQSATASSSYRSGERLYSERYDKTSFYVRETKPETFILKPNHAPEWALNREQLWNQVEAVEKAKNALIAREINIALPIELSNEQQRQLTEDYVQKNFVDEGMVADVAIHRDDENNPHFHVMLTTRPFKNKGIWASKSRKEYILDEEGKKTYTERGHARSRKINFTNWDEQKNATKWRKNWADLTNNYLEREGFSARISEKSHKERGLQKEPTIHEGYGSRNMEKNGEKSDRCQINRDIKERNVSKEKEQKNDVNQQTKQSLVDDLKEERKNKASEQEKGLISKDRSLEKEERMIIGRIAKNLKVYVNYDNLLDKERMVNNWESSTQIKAQLHPDKDFDNAFKNIEHTKENIQQGKDILNKQFSRIYDKFYVDYSENLPMYYKMAIAQRTLQEDRVLNEEELNDTVINAGERQKDYMLKTITQRPYHVPYKTHMIHLSKTSKEIEAFKENHHVTDDTVHTLHNDDKNTFETLSKKQDIQIRTMNVLDSYYTNTIKEQYPTANVEYMKQLEKEAVSKTIDYYGNAYTFGTILDIANKDKAIPNRFNQRQQQLGVQYVVQLDKTNTIDFDELPKDQEVYDVVTDRGLRPIFLEEAKRNGLESDVEALEHPVEDNQERTRDRSHGIQFSRLVNNLHLLNHLGRANEENLRREMDELRNNRSTRTKQQGKGKRKGKQRKGKEQSKQQSNDLSL